MNNHGTHDGTSDQTDDGDERDFRNLWLRESDDDTHDYAAEGDRGDVLLLCDEHDLHAIRDRARELLDEGETAEFHVKSASGDTRLRCNERQVRSLCEQIDEVLGL